MPRFEVSTNETPEDCPGNFCFLSENEDSLMVPWMVKNYYCTKWIPLRTVYEKETICST